MSSASEISLADVPRQLRTHFGVAISYQKLYALVVAGSIPARHAHNQRWTIARRDLKKIAAFIEEQAAERQRIIDERREDRALERQGIEVEYVDPVRIVPR